MFLLVLMSVLVVGVIFLAQKWQSEQKLGRICVKGNSIISTEEIYSLISTGEQLQSFGKLNFEQLRSKVLAHPFILSVDILQDNTNNDITFEIKERTPIAIVAASNGSLSFIDNTGSFMPYLIFDGMADMPVINFKKTPKKPIGEVLKTAAQLISSIKNSGKIAVFNSISELVWNGENFDLLMDNAVFVELGNEADANEKIVKLACFLDSPEKQALLQPINKIDLRWNELVVVQ